MIVHFCSSIKLIYELYTALCLTLYHYSLNSRACSTFNCLNYIYQYHSVMTIRSRLSYLIKSHNGEIPPQLHSFYTLSWLFSQEWILPLSCVCQPSTAWSYDWRKHHSSIMWLCPVVLSCIVVAIFTVLRLALPSNIMYTPYQVIYEYMVIM